MIARGAGLSVFFATTSKQQFPETGAAESEKQAKTSRGILQQWVFSAKPEQIGECETRHLDELVRYAQAAGAIIANVGDRVSIAYSRASVMQNRLSGWQFSAVHGLSSWLFSTALRSCAAVWHHGHTSGVEQPGHTFVIWMQH